MKRLALLICLFHAVGVAYGQLPDSELPAKNPSTLPGSSNYASEKIEIRKFDQKKWREIVESRNYTETRDRKPQQDQNVGLVDSDQRSGPRALDDDDPDRYDYNTEDGINL